MRRKEGEGGREEVGTCGGAGVQLQGVAWQAAHCCELQSSHSGAVCMSCVSKQAVRMLGLGHRCLLARPKGGGRSTHNSPQWK